eukprot:3042306-Alexandrium_andersonii.AAC.1
MNSAPWHFRSSTSAPMRWLKRRHLGSAADRLANCRAAFWQASRLNGLAQATASRLAPAW